MELRSVQYAVNKHTIEHSKYICKLYGFYERQIKDSNEMVYVAAKVNVCVSA